MSSSGPWRAVGALWGWKRSERAIPHTQRRVDRECGGRFEPLRAVGQSRHWPREKHSTGSHLPLRRWWLWGTHSWPAWIGTWRASCLPMARNRRARWRRGRGDPPQRGRLPLAQWPEAFPNSVPVPPKRRQPQQPHSGGRPAVLHPRPPRASPRVGPWGHQIPPPGRAFVRRVVPPLAWPQFSSVSDPVPLRPDPQGQRIRIRLGPRKIPVRAVPIFANCTIRTIPIPRSCPEVTTIRHFEAFCDAAGHCRFRCWHCVRRHRCCCHHHHHHRSRRPFRRVDRTSDPGTTTPWTAVVGSGTVGGCGDDGCATGATNYCSHPTTTNHCRNGDGVGPDGGEGRVLVVVVVERPRRVGRTLERSPRRQRIAPNFEEVVGVGAEGSVASCAGGPAGWSAASKDAADQDPAGDRLSQDLDGDGPPSTPREDHLPGVGRVDPLEEPRRRAVAVEVGTEAGVVPRHSKSGGRSMPWVPEAVRRETWVVLVRWNGGGSG